MNDKAKILELERENTLLRDENGMYKKERMELKSFIDELFNKLEKAYEKIEELEKELKEQRQLISNIRGEEKPNKTSKNSDIPPSKDLYRADRRRSLREKSGLKPGGQKGHKGNTLEFTLNPDRVEDIYKDYCEYCNRRLDKGKWLLKSSRQQIDVSRSLSEVIQFNIYEQACVCGKKVSSKFPEEIKGYVQYGPVIRGLINYFSVRQYIPFKRMSELFKDCYGLKLGEGSIGNTLRRSSVKMEGIYNHIKDKIGISEWLGSDETTIFTNGKKNTLWTWQNNEYTYLYVANSRHSYHIDEVFPNGLPNSILSSDQYKAQLGTRSKGHQICWVHILRKIVYLKELKAIKWLDEIKGVYKEGVMLKEEKSKWRKGSRKALELEKELDRLLLKELGKDTPKEIKKFQTSLQRDRAYLLTFLYHGKVPPDNNSSEQAIRNAKVKTKISRGFKSLQQSYAITRSVIDTCIKNQVNILNTLIDIEKGNDISFITT